MTQTETKPLTLRERALLEVQEAEERRRAEAEARAEAACVAIYDSAPKGLSTMTQTETKPLTLRERALIEVQEAEERRRAEAEARAMTAYRNDLRDLLYLLNERLGIVVVEASLNIQAWEFGDGKHPVWTDGDITLTYVRPSPSQEFAQPALRLWQTCPSCQVGHSLEPVTSLESIGLALRGPAPLCDRCQYGEEDKTNGGD